MKHSLYAIESRVSALERLLETTPATIPIFEEKQDIVGIDIAAKILGLKKNTIYVGTRKKTIPHMKKGKFLYFSVNELNLYLLSGKISTVK